MYSVFQGDISVGSVQLDRAGLYYNIICSCAPMGIAVYRLVAKSKGETIRLGVLTPEDHGFGLRTKIPAKILDKDSLAFFLEIKNNEEHGRFILVSEDIPFAYIERLRESHMFQMDGKIGIMVPK